MDETYKDYIKNKAEPVFRALNTLGNQIMRDLHAPELQSPTIQSAVVVGWLRELYDVVQDGRGRPRHFDQLDIPD